MSLLFWRKKKNKEKRGERSNKTERLSPTRVKYDLNTSRKEPRRTTGERTRKFKSDDYDSAISSYSSADGSFRYIREQETKQGRTTSNYSDDNEDVYLQSSSLVDVHGTGDGGNVTNEHFRVKVPIFDHIKDSYLRELSNIPVETGISADDNTVAVWKFKASTTQCVYESISYLDCEGAVSHKSTKTPRVSCSSNKYRQIFSTKKYDLINLFEKITRILQLEDEKPKCPCSDSYLKFNFCVRVRLLCKESLNKKRKNNMLEKLYTAKYVFAIPIYHLLECGTRIRDNVNAFPSRNEAIHITLKCIENELLKKEERSLSIVKICLCQSETDMSKVVVLSYYEGEHSPVTNEINGIRVVWRKYSYVSNEAKLLNDRQNVCYEKGVSKPIPPLISNKTAAHLFREHSNITMISSSEYKSVGFRSLRHRFVNCKCVQLFCKTKGFIPYGEKKFPTKIDSFDVDVLEGYCRFGSNRIKMGAAIGAQGQQKTGSLGGFVDISDEEIGFITCAHTVFSSNDLLNGRTEDSNLKMYTFSPSNPTEYEECGIVLKSVFNHSNESQTSVDAALIKVQTAISDSFPDVSPTQLRKSGFDERSPPCYHSGEIITTIKNRNQRVIKYGPVSNLTCGTLALDGLHVRIQNENMSFPPTSHFLDENISQSVIMYGQYGVHSHNNDSFFEIGDSGSFVFMVEENENDLSQNLKCVGMAVGIVEGSGICIVTPIKDVLDSFKPELNIKLKKFSNRNFNENIFGDLPQRHSVEDILRNMSERSELSFQRLENGMRELNTYFNDFKKDVNERFSSVENAITVIQKEIKQNISNDNENDKEESGNSLDTTHL